MNEIITKRNELLAQTVIKGLKSRNMTGYYAATKEEAKQIAHNAKTRYRKVIEDLPEFEKGDRFKMNIVSCAMYGAFCLNMKKLPSIQSLKQEYAQLSEEKRKLYPDMKAARAEMIDLMTAKNNVDRILGLQEKQAQKLRSQER